MVGAGWVNAVLVGDHLPELEIQNKMREEFNSIKLGFNVHIQSKLMYHTPVMGTQSSY